MTTSLLIINRLTFHVFYPTPAHQLIKHNYNKYSHLSIKKTEKHWGDLFNHPIHLLWE